MVLFSQVFQLFFILCHYYPGKQIRDLQRNDACFALEAASWTASAISPGETIYNNECDNTYLVGGPKVLGNGGQYGDFFSVTYTSLPTHTMVYFSLTMFAIDNWQNDEFTLSVGSASFTSWNNFDKNNFAQNYCGGGAKDLKDIRIFGKAAHTGSSLTFKVISLFTQNSANRAFGIRNVELIFASPSSLYSNEMCGRAGIPITTYQCSCNTGFYLNSVTCTPCDPSCASCFGPGPSQCYACKKGYSWDGTSCFGCDLACSLCYGLLNTECSSCQSGYLLFQNTTCIPSLSCASPLLKTGCNTYCESPCSSPSDFLYWNGTCLSTCLFPHQQSTILISLKTCVYPCQSTEYLYWDGTCSAVCGFPLLTRIEAGKQYCDYPCLNTQFLYWNGTCASNCLSPLTQGTIGNRNFCYYLCANNQYLYWDGSCYTSCSSPLILRVEGGKNYCDYPCLPGQYLYWDGTCSSTCPYPFHQKTEWDKYFCNYPCTGTQYLYWDTACESTCAPPLVITTVGSKKFCNSPCALNQYLYWNTTCLSSCNSPHVVQFRAEVNYCIYPCNPGEYLYMNGSCISNCRLPFRPKLEAGKYYCDAICPTRSELFWDGSCISSCDFPLRFSTNSSGTYCNIPCNTPSEYYFPDSRQCKTSCVGASEKGLYLRCLAPGDGVKPIELTRLLQHIRYLNVNLPPKLQFMEVSRQMNFFSMRVISSTFESIKGYILKATFVSKFEKYVFTNSFLANLFEELILLGIILGCGIVFIIIELFSKVLKFFYPQIIFERLRVLTLWNLCLILITINAEDIIFFARMELKTFDLSSTTATISFGICIFMLVALIVTYIANFVIVIKIQAFKKEALRRNTRNFYTDYLLKWESIQVLFRGFKDTNILTHSFYLTYGLRLALPMVVASFLSLIPIAQSVLYVVISAIMTGFLLYFRPIKNKINQINVVLIELVVLAANASALVITVLDYYNIDIYGVHVFFGDVIITMNFCIDLLAFIFLPIKIIAGLRHALWLRRNYSSEELGAWLFLLFIPIQQGGLGFEQVQIVSAFTISRIKNIENKLRVAALSARTQNAGLETESTIKPLASSQAKNSQPLIVINDTSQNEKFETIECLDQSNSHESSNTELLEINNFKRRRCNNFRQQSEKSLNVNLRNEHYKKGNRDDKLASRLNNMSNLNPGLLRNSYSQQNLVTRNKLDLLPTSPFQAQNDF